MSRCTCTSQFFCGSDWLFWFWLTLTHSNVQRERESERERQLVRDNDASHLDYFFIEDPTDSIRLKGTVADLVHSSKLLSFHAGILAGCPKWGRADCHLLYVIHWLWMSTSYNPTLKNPNCPFKAAIINIFILTLDQIAVNVYMEVVAPQIIITDSVAPLSS